MKLRWLLLSILGMLVFGSPADAGQLLSWEFEQKNNRLVFITDEGVQPKAKLIANPTRLVIELPNTQLGRTTVKEEYLGAIRGFRIGQSTDNTVSLVLELAPGYTIDPEQVKFRGASSTQWTVDLPSPRIADFTPASQPIRTSDSNSASSPTTTVAPVVEAETTSENQNQILQAASPYVRITSHGFFLDLKGDRSNKITSTRKDNTINFDLQGVTLPADLVSQSVAVNQYGVENISFTQNSDVATIQLQVTAESPEWRALFSRIEGLILVPGGKRTVVTNKPPRIIDKNPNNKRSNAATIRAIDLTDNGNKLSIRSDGNLTASSRLIGNGTYQIIINNAKLGKPFAGPQLTTDSPISELKVKEEGSAVVLTVTTKLGIRLGRVQNGTNLIALPIVTPPTPIAIPNAKPPVVPRSKPLVIIDAGHGGQDPGTIGIGGVQEKNVVLPISLDVAEELRKQGIEVRMTRDRDYFISLEGRTDMANKIDADLFVSIHANAINLSRPDVNGLETYYYKSGRRLAEVIHWNILNTVNIKNRNIRRARFFVLRHSEMPAVLVEVGFLTGAEDASRLKNPNHRRQMAQAIARGIIQYIKENRI